MNIEDLKKQIEKDLAGIAVKTVRESLLVEKTADLPKVAAYLKDHADLKLDYLSGLRGADYLTYIECVYHLYSMEKKGPAVQLRVRADREKPVIPSLVSLYRGAEYQERESYDMFGIHFEGHPDLRRIFMWDEFQGWPLRKDYEQEDVDTLEMEDIEWLRARGVKVSEEDRKRAEELKAEGKRAVAQKPDASS